MEERSAARVRISKKRSLFHDRTYLPEALYAEAFGLEFIHEDGDPTSQQAWKNDCIQMILPPDALRRGACLSGW